jgi:hypothetical protein
MEKRSIVESFRNSERTIRMTYFNAITYLEADIA